MDSAASRPARSSPFWKWRGPLVLLLVVLALQWVLWKGWNRLLAGGDVSGLQMGALAVGILGLGAFCLAWARTLLGRRGAQGRVLGGLETAFRTLLALPARDKGARWYAWAMAAAYPDQVQRYLERAAGLGHRGAHFELGLIAEEGGLGEGGREVALRAYRNAASRGHEEAAFRLARLLWWGNGRGVREPQEALRWFQRSAQAGFGPAMAWLAQALERGDGMAADPEAAAQWRARLEASSLGTTLRASRLSHAWEEPGGKDLFPGVGAAWEEGGRALAELPGFGTAARFGTWVLVALLVLGFVIAIGLLLLFPLLALPGLLGLGFLAFLHLRLRRDMRQSGAFRRLEREAAAGDPDACFRKGMALQRGTAEHPRDPIAAGDWLLRAAQAGQVDAMAEWADMCAWGVGGPVRMDEARAWFQRAAEAGHPGARARLATLGPDPDGVQDRPDGIPGAEPSR